jgi:GNAT superfamily N-acetyltransferase
MVEGVREADCGDERALRDLAAACPMIGPICYCLEREPDFFTLTNLQGQNAQVGVIDGAEPGTIDAMATSVGVMRRIGGAVRPLRYLADFKVHPRARGRGLAGRLMRRAGDDLARDRIPGFGIVLAGNRAMSPLLARSEAHLRFRPIARLCNHSVLIARSPRSRASADARKHAPAPVAFRRAKRSDAGELVALWNRVQPGRELSPVWDETSWLRQVDATPGLALEQFWIAERGGRPVAFAAAWDASAIKQLRLLSLSRRLRWLRPLYNASARLLGRPRIVADGELVPFVYVTHFCAESADDFRALLARMHDELARSSYLYFDIALDVRDPLVRSLDGFFKTSLAFDLHSITPRGVEPPELGRGPAYFDMALV